MKEKKILKAGTLYFIGNIFDKAVAFITVPIFTRMLSTSDYGVTTTYLSWVSILTVIITLSLGNSIRTAVVDFESDKDGYLSSIFALGTISAIIMSGGICIVSYMLGTDADLFRLIVCCCMQAYASSIIQAIQWRYMMDLRYLARTLLQSLPNIVVIVLSIYFIYTMEENKYWGRVYASVGVYFILGVVYLFYYWFKGKSLVNIRYWKYALAFSLPIIFHSLSVVILSQADRTMITWLRNSAETGIYSLAYQFGMVPQVFTATFENVWIPWFTKKMQSNEKDEINRMVRPYINTVAILCCGIMLVAPEVLKFMTTESYYSAVYIIAPVISAVFLTFLASVSIDLEYYLKKTKTIASNTIVAAVVNIVLNYIFIARYGAIAAAFTTVASYAVSFVMHYCVTRKLDPELFKFKTYIFPIIFVAVFTILTNVLMNYAVVRWGIGVILGIVFLYNSLKVIKLNNK